ncbi:MAG: DMT family transporter [Bacteroidales bacterium]|jgi:drug/metabolite transporter (DMT)-like permease|nr:DMT family transporter [Bacteroidales bacterium]
MNKSRVNTWAHLALLGANIIYGLNFSIAKYAMPDQIKPFALVSLRSVMAALMFWGASFFVRREKVERKDLLYLFACSFFGVVINQTLFLVGLNMTSPINSSIILATNPIFAFIFAAFILKENISLAKGIGLATGLSGVMILILQNGTPDVSSRTFMGDLYTLINTVSWAFYTVIIKRMLTKYHPVTVMKWTFLFGMFTNIPVGYHQWSTMDWGAINLYGWLSIGFVVVFATFLGYLLLTIGLRRMSPTVVSTYTYTQPVIAAYLATLLGQDNIRLVMVIAALLIFGGVFFVSWPGFNRDRQN